MTAKRKQKLERRARRKASKRKRNDKRLLTRAIVEEHARRDAEPKPYLIGPNAVAGRVG